MKLRTKIVFLIKVAVFIGLLCLLINNIAYVLRQKELASVQDNFAALEPDSVDTVFIGTSHQYCSIDPDLLYEEYGMNSFMLATSGQTVPLSYYAAMEAIELQHPDTIIMEVLYCSNDFREIGSAMSHMFFDGMPDCMAKKAAIEDVMPKEEQIYYYLNLGYYHSRWKELTEADFQSNLTSPRGGFHSEELERAYDIYVLPPEEKEPMPEEMKKYMDLLIELCELNDVELIWYVAPFGPLYYDDAMWQDLYRRQRIFNWMEDYAAENGIEYHNLFHELNEIGLDITTDFMDSQHLNCYGQEKLTRYMAQKGYLTPKK